MTSELAYYNLIASGTKNTLKEHIMYKNILLATDLTETNRKVIQKAIDYSQQFNARLDVIHVVEPATSYAYAAALGFAEPETPSTDLAQQVMNAMRKEYNVPSEQCHIKIGSAKNEILKLGEELKVGLIIIGSHGHHGITKILGSTTNAILHGAKCDVVTVRVG